MNDYMVYVNGTLAPYGLFSARSETSVNMGRFLRMHVDKDRLKDVPKRIDITEIRAGKMIKRYAWDKDHGQMREQPADEGAATWVVFDCLGLPNSF